MYLNFGAKNILLKSLNALNLINLIYGFCYMVYTLHLLEHILYSKFNYITQYYTLFNN